MIGFGSLAFKWYLIMVVDFEMKKWKSGWFWTWPESSLWLSKPEKKNEALTQTKPTWATLIYQFRHNRKQMIVFCKLQDFLDTSLRYRFKKDGWYMNRDLFSNRTVTYGAPRCLGRRKWRLNTVHNREHFYNHHQQGGNIWWNVVFTPVWFC